MSRATTRCRCPRTSEDSNRQANTGARPFPPGTSPSVISYSSCARNILGLAMTSLPQFHASQRTARVPLADITPAVLRFDDGSCSLGRLQTISLTGGLLCLPRPLDQGSRVKLVFLTHTGPVLGAAEMLRPLSWSLQPSSSSRSGKGISTDCGRLFSRPWN